MPRFSAIKRRTTGAAQVAYDNRYGTDTATAASTGWFTFGLRPGCRRVWVNSTQADDSGDGLTAATAKKTLTAAKALFGTSPTPGDQLMIAGTGGRSYSDSTYNFTLDFAPGYSATYPTAYLCYDPANPGDTTKYGKLYGADRPIILMPDTANTNSAFLSTTYDFNASISHIAVQGLILDGQNLSRQAIGSVGRHDNMIWQNCQFKQTATGLNNGNRTNGTASGGNISKCSFYGSWDATSGNANAIYLDGVTGWYVQDNVFVHCGWKVGSSRNDTTSAGGPSVFGHSVYYHAGNTGCRFDRNVYVDSAADGWGMRGTCSATQLVSWDEPIVGALTGISTSYTEAPLGDLATIDDFCSFGGSDLNSAGGGERGSGISVNNAASGTYARNGVLFDNPRYGVSGNNWLLGMISLGAGAAASSVLMDKIRTYNFAAVAQDLPSSSPNSVTSTWSNSLLDSLNKTLSSSPAGTISGTGVRTWTVGDYPNAKTADQVATDMLTGMGVTPGASYAARKAQVVNYMLEYPHLDWVRAFLGVVFPAFGATPQYQTASIPNVSALPTPTTVYTAATPTRI